VDFNKLIEKPIVKVCDFAPQECVQEAIEVTTMAMDKFISKKDYDGAAKAIKDQMDKKFGTLWHCAIGEGFGFDVTYQQKNMMYIYYGQVGILIYKC